MYQYYAYTMGWGHNKFKSPSDWFLKGYKNDPILNWIHNESSFSNPFDDSYLRKHVSTDIKAYQIKEISDLALRMWVLFNKRLL